jgi:hypothetical protein
MNGGLGSGVSGLSTLVAAQSRAITPENFTGAKGAAASATEGAASAAARDLGRGWKVSPFVHVPAGSTFELAAIEGPGVVRQIWLTPAGCAWRHLIIRMYWDGQAAPSVECPLGDFFASGWGGTTGAGHAQVSSLPVCVNPGSGLNCFWEMPFRQGCRMTIENRSDDEARIYYQINYELCEVGEDAAYFHAQFRRSNPLEYQTEQGEVKFYLDGDDEWPTIASTGTEDYFLGSYNFWVNGRYKTFTTPYSGLPEAIIPDGSDPGFTQSRFGMYRWHLTDPVRFGTDLRVTVQALGWRSGRRYLPLRDDIASVAFWYQTLPDGPFPALAGADDLEII